MTPLVDGPWKLGLDSVSDSLTLPEGTYAWLINGINKGGIISTRPGQRIRQLNISGNPSAIKVFTPKGGVPHIVISVGSSVYYCEYPFTDLTWRKVEGVAFVNGQCEFEIAVVGVTQDVDGSIVAIDPFPVLMMFDGQTRTAFWDGVTARHLDPGPASRETPICTWAKFIGNRLWTMQGKKIRVSDLLNPIKFTEEDILAEGGFFNLPDAGTGFGVTPNFQSLLAFTDFSTTAFQAGILNRAQWQTTPDFQKVIFSNIGCAAGRSIVNQYGMVWWYSHNGLINLDNALQTYRSSQIRYMDRAMRRSRANMSDDISGICSVAYENYLLVSVPSGDMKNYHTWIMDSNPQEATESQAQWSAVWTGTRPMQYATGIVNGKIRCFCLSSDIPPNGESVVILQSANVWEMFLQDRRDIGQDVHATITAKNVDVAFETRMMSTNTYGTFKYAELELENIVGAVQLDVFYCPLRGTYKNILSRQIVATVGGLTPSTTIPTTFAPYLSQKRTIRTVNESVASTDNNLAVETPLNRNKDKAFSVLVKWTGQASMSRLRIYVDAEPDQIDGTPTETELKDRYITAEGTGAILTTGPTALPLTNQQSGFLSTNSPRWDEGIYKSLT